ncbi:MAG TPA: hypothetical protein VFA27_14830 [Vicinamibacterales bacterium]|nr:hypothetical protein [Vicinamibacterales bacterium]
MTATDQTEYSELRATIRERGTARVWIFVVGILGWAALSVAAAALALPPLFAVVPLLALIATFEAVYALHLGAERIGRYLEVFHEADVAGWETRTKWLAPIPQGAKPDALFTAVFAIAAVLTLFTANLFDVTAQERWAVTVPVVLFLVRVARAKSFAGKQRGTDLERFRQLKAENR